MKTVYKINTNHGSLDYDKCVFKSKEKCQEIIKDLVKKGYGEPVYSEDSDEVKKVNSYWSGDISKDELGKMLKDAYMDAFQSALYYDCLNMYWIDEFKLID